MRSSTFHGNHGRTLFLAGVLLVLVSMLPAATAAPPGPSALMLGAADDGRQIVLAAGQTLSITLEANPSTGYRWEVDSPDQAIMRQVGTRFEQPAGRLGAPGKQILELMAVRAGQSTLRLVYRRPWEKGVQPVKVFSLLVQSQGASTLPDALPPTPEATPKSSVSLDARPALGLPAAFNWCDVNGCTPVKDQGNCGSCWAFATVGPLEANVKIWDGLTRDMAEQYLVSCASEYNGCNGGSFAHDYHQWKIPDGEAAAGAVYENDFPYQARDASQGVGCDFTPQPHVHHEKIAAWNNVSSGYGVPAAADIKQAIYEHGPVAATICVGSGFQGYTGGIFQTSDYCTGGVNHAIVLVGWNDADQVWYLRNSWGDAWGERGYMRIKWGTSSVGYDANYIVYGAPSNLTATPTSSSQINLSWTDKSGAESGFKIERLEDGVAGWAQVATVGVDVTSYSDTGLACNTTFDYRVRAYTSSANGSYSDTASAQTFACSGAPAAPTDLTAVAASQTQVNLSWTDNSNEESGFRIERSPNGASGWTRIYTTTANVTSYSNTGLDCNTTYYYRVHAYNASGNSNNSAVAQVTTLECPGCQDEYEPDDNYTQAKLIQVNAPAQHRNLHVAGDEDWAKFTAVAGKVYTITTSNLGINNDTYLYLYDTNGATVLAYDDDGGSQPLSSKIVWMAPGNGVYYVKVRNYYGGLGDCTGYEYDLALEMSSWKVYLPQVFTSPTARTPNDPYYSLYQWGPLQVNAPLAWAQSTGAGTTIAVVDSGVDLNHPDLTSKIVSGWDFANGDSVPQDDNGHGTHVAGIAAAATDNQLGVAGLGWDAYIMPVKVLDSDGSGYDSDIANGIYWATDHGAQVINLSVGGEDWSEALQDATDYAFSHGALVVAAAGNCGDPTFYYPCRTHNPTIYPAANPNVLAVGATTASDVRASFSEYGYFVDVTAPGVSIYSTLWNDSYGYMSGTSMASPLVAGVAALAWARRPTLSNAQIASVIQGSADDLGAPGRDDKYGYGRVDAAGAVAAAGSLAAAASSVEESSRPAAVRTPADAPVRPGVVLMRFKPGALAADRQSVLTRYGLRIAGQLGTAGVIKLEAPVGRERDIAAQLAAEPAVEFAEPDYKVRFFN